MRSTFCASVRCRRWRTRRRKAAAAAASSSSGPPFSRSSIHDLLLWAAYKKRRAEEILIRIGYAAVGILALLLGALGAFLPLLPTIPFVILAAFCFARSNPAWERRLLAHRRFGPHIAAWRERGAISRRGKQAAIVAFAASAAIGLLMLSFPWALVPLLAALIGGSWILTRPSR